MSFPFPDLSFEQQRHAWDSACFSEVSVLRFPAEEMVFVDIDQRDRGVKLSQLCYLRSLKAILRGNAHPLIVAFARLEKDCSVDTCLPGIDPHTDAGERLCSANSLITYTLRELLTRGWLRYAEDEWRTVVPDGQAAWEKRAKSVLDLMVGHKRLFVGGLLGRRVSTVGSFEGFDARRDLAPVDGLGFIREFVWHEKPRVAFNAAYFLLEHDDYFSHHSGLGEAYNLFVRDGQILRPPLYRRGAFFRTADGRWRADPISMADLSIQLPDGTHLVPEGSGLLGIPFALNPQDDAEVAVYTRAYGLKSHGAPLRKTPPRPGRVEYTVVDTRIVGHKQGGDLNIPQNGLVLSAAPEVLGPDIAPVGMLPRLKFSFAHKGYRGIQQAIQAGPLLMHSGETVISSQSLADEEFSPSPLGSERIADIGVVPTDYPEDVDRTRAGRMGLGVDAAGKVVVVAAPGTERGTYRPDADSAGAALTELAGFLAEAGAVDAINLDGGGSTQLFYLGGLASTPGNRFGTPGMQFERMVPSICALP